MVCGLNGVGKSTLGKALAEKLNYTFIDAEDLYFTKTNDDYSYASPRTHDEAAKLLLSKIKADQNFILASVKGDFGEKITPIYKLVIVICVPKEIRMQRVINRSHQQFGDRMLPDGDLYDQEQRFFDSVRSRSENSVDKWLDSLNLPVIRIDGTRPVADNIGYIMQQAIF